jgi:hypothetical protein
MESLFFHATNEEDSQVGFTQAELAQLSGAVLTHNHPGGRSFSKEDVWRDCFGSEVEAGY